MSRYAITVDGQEIELSTLDLTSAREDAHGGLVVTLTLWASQENRTERLPVEGKPGLYAWGKRYRSTLSKPVNLTMRLDLGGLHALAQRAVRSRGGKAKAGPVAVRGGKGATFKREDV